MDAIKLLKNDHKEVKKLLDELHKTRETSVHKRLELLERIGNKLTVHSTIEEQVFYPAFQHAVKKREDHALYYEAKEEHELVAEALEELAAVDPMTVSFDGRAKVLKDLVEHHAEEEEKEMFPAAKKVLSTQELEVLGERMEHLKDTFNIQLGLDFARTTAVAAKRVR